MIQTASAVRPFSSPRIRVAICSAGELWGGVEQFIVTLAGGLRHRGIEPHVLLFHDAQLADVLRRQSVTTEVLRGKHAYDPGLVSTLRQVFEREQVNVVHAHGYKGTVTAALAVKGLKRGNVRLIKTEHGRLESPSTWRAVPSYLRLALNVAVDTVATRTTADRVVYVSKDIRNVRTRWCGAGDVIYNGLSPTAAGSAVRSAPRDSISPFTIGIVGRLTAVKGHIYLLRALTALPGTRLKVFGTGPDDDALRAAAAGLGIADRVDFAGFVSPIHPAMAALDLLAMPSLHEGLPYTLLEAMSLGVPVVASRVGGLVEAIEDGVSGLLINPKDPDALAEAIGRIRANPDWARALAQRAFERVTSEFHADRMVDHYLDAYNDAIA